MNGDVTQGCASLAGLLSFAALGLPVWLATPYYTSGLNKGSATSSWCLA